MQSGMSFPLALYPPDPQVHIRPVKNNDAPLLYRCCLTDEVEQYAYDLVIRALRIQKQGRGLGFVIEGKDDLPLYGYGQFTIWAGCGEISDLIVAESCRSKGYGTALIQYLTRYARSLSLHCVEIGVALSNPRALALYERLGFTPYRTLDMNFGNGEEPVQYLRITLPN